MIIGVVKEIKNNENRVSLTPAGAEALRDAGHKVLVEAGAGLGSGFADEAYAGFGAEIISDKRQLFDASDMIMKVKEPLPPEYDLFHAGQILFTYLHLAPEPELTAALLKAKVKAGARARAGSPLWQPGRGLAALAVAEELPRPAGSGPAARHPHCLGQNPS